MIIYMKRVKLFLGAYIDSINAQDINCCAIAKYINKERFEIHALTHGKDVEIAGITVHKISNNRILKNIEKYWIMKKINADIYYLPRVERVDILFAKHSKNKIVSSVEIQTVYDNRKYKKFFNEYISGYFCISNFLNELNEKYWGKKVPVLYLGANIESYKTEHISLKRIAYVGSVIERKRPYLFVDLSKLIPETEFVMIGDGDLLTKMKDMAVKNNIKNICFKGKLNNVDVLKELSHCDLLVITSKKEGLPKIVLEAASVNVPTIYINENYSIDYIENRVNGFSAENFEEMKKTVLELIDNNELYKSVSARVGNLASEYSWKNLISGYEKYFLSIVNDGEYNYEN